MATDRPTGKLAAAICEVMAAVPYIQQTGHNKHGRYHYASDADLMSALQPAMVDAGLALVPTGAFCEMSEHSPTKANAAQWRADLIQTFTLLHTSGESIDIQTVGCGTDGQDKAPYMAMTGAIKYALRQLFLVPTGEDAEHDAGRSNGGQKAPERAAQKAANKAAAQTAPQGEALAAGVRTKCNIAIEAGDASALPAIKAQCNRIEQPNHKASAVRWYALASLMTNADMMAVEALQWARGLVDGLPDDNPHKSAAVTCADAALGALEGRVTA